MKKEEDIHSLIKEKFGRSLRHDERFSEHTYSTWVANKSLEGKTAPGDLTNVPESASPYHRPEPTPDMEIRLRAIELVWPQLTERQKEAVQLCGKDEMSVREAAKTMRISPAAVQGHLRLARMKIENEYKKQIEEDR